jgi:predicted phage terminase large subunit-like protein
LAQITKQKTEIYKKLKQDMILFGKVCMPQMFSSDSPDFHYKIAEQLIDTEQKQINIVAPRGHAKSSIVGGVFPLYHLMFGEGKKLIVLVSRTQDHAVKLLGLLKDTMDYSEPFRSLFGYWGSHSAKSWAKSEIELKDGSMIICKGTGQQLRGIKVGNQRPTLIIVDDPEDENNTKTAEAMESNLRWLLQSAVPSVDPNKGRIIIIGTPQHQRCLVETLQSMKGWLNMTFKPDIDNGKALWEEWWSIKKLIQKKEELESINRLSVFYREFMCEIVGDEDQLFKKDDFQYFTGKFFRKRNKSYLHIFTKNGIKADEIKAVNVFTGVDPASSVKQGADYSVIFNMAIDEEGNRYALPYYRKHATPLNLAEAIVDNFKLYRSEKTRIESVGYQEMLREYVIKRSKDEGIFIPGLNIKENPRTSKSHRLESLQPLFAKHQVHIMEDQLDFIDELLLFPRGKHDDILDGFYYANKGSYEPYHKYEDATLITKGRKLLNRIDWQTA